MTQNEEIKSAGGVQVGKQQSDGEVAYNSFTNCNKRYGFSVRKKLNAEEYYLVFTETNLIGEKNKGEKPFTHRIRVYVENIEQFKREFDKTVSTVIALNKKE